MNCAWEALVRLLPGWIRQQVDPRGRESLRELRLRLGRPPELVGVRESGCGAGAVTHEDLQYVINTASRYSPWAAATAAKGYITAPGGHRIGLCGQAVTAGGEMTGIRDPDSLCIRVARDFPGISRGASGKGSLLIIGSPGSGKTTLLRDLIRSRSDYGGRSIAVVDEREELFPRWQGKSCFPPGARTDVLWGCPKAAGVETVLRSMGPGTIAVDEITGQADCNALYQAGWCGVDLLATAHAGSMEELMTRPVYKPLVVERLFERVLILDRNNTWHEERMCL